MHSILKEFKIRMFEKTCQAKVDSMMAEIQREFSEKFTAPDSLSISQLSEIDGNIFWLAFHNEEVIGTVGLSLFDSRNAILKRLFVAKAFRGNHYRISQQLLETAINHSKQLKLASIYLGTMAQFEAAQAFYVKNNFVRVSKSELPPGMKLSSLDTLFYKLFM